MFFRNGGGPCYIVSLGPYSTAGPSKADFEKGLGELAKEDEPTLILMPDAVGLGGGYYELYQQALDQCEDLGDRFAVIDVLYDPLDSISTHATNFRDDLVSNHLDYGAAYYPKVETTLSWPYEPSSVSVKHQGWKIGNGQGLFIIPPSGNLNTPILQEDPLANSGSQDFQITNTLVIANLGANGKSASDLVADFLAWETTSGVSGWTLKSEGGGSKKIKDSDLPAKDLEIGSLSLGDLQSSNTGLYNTIKEELAQNRIEMYPSAIMAGIYAAVDNDRGVWKAPANVVLNSVIHPLLKINSKDQEGLNIDPTSGKSINAIRTFPGQGTLIWGARTLAGNDNEWRYVNVRRLFIMVEESIKKASARFVFEPNDANTWTLVKAMIDGFLTNLWRDGALAGPTKESSFFVNVGLGTTMTTDDILNGRMKIEIGLAAVRPAEFIILKFSHKMQEA
jgi:hypothetical protein